MWAPVAFGNAVADAAGRGRGAAAEPAARVGADRDEARAVPLQAAQEPRRGRRAAPRARRRSEGARRWPDARAVDQPAARRGRRSSSTSPASRASTVSDDAAVAATVRQRGSPACPSSPSRCPSSATSSPATAARSAGRSHTPTRARSCRSAWSSSAGPCAGRRPRAAGRGVLRLALQEPARPRRDPLATSGREGGDLRLRGGRPAPGDYAIAACACSLGMDGARRGGARRRRCGRRAAACSTPVWRRARGPRDRAEAGGRATRPSSTRSGTSTGGPRTCDL